MELFDFAIQMEMDGERYYRDIAAKSLHKGIISILTGLADQEVKHRKFLEKMQTGKKGKWKEEDIFLGTKNIFMEMKEMKESFVFDKDEIDLYKKALEIEEKSKKFYLEKAKEVQDQKQKDLLLKIAEEENRHYFLVENLIDFMSKPKTWLENAEWVHLDEY
jgi:rubrerythrin